MAFRLNLLPFKCPSVSDLSAKWSEWIGQVFYDLLPTKGFEIRDEQIYTAFQIATAMQRNTVHLAEAGLGTGKTFAYLVNGLVRARLTNRPVIISCASTILQEQLAGAHGDIAVLSAMLDLAIDSRLAKHPAEYVCDTKVERLASFTVSENGQLAKALEWATETKTGNRAEIPQVPDQVWSQLAWDDSLDCDACASRGFCRKTKAHDLYRTARDFVVCNHEFFFTDLWTRRERTAEGRRPLLPEYSGVVFDEGHRIFLPAARAAGKKLIKDDLESMLLRLEKLPDARTALLSAIVAVDSGVDKFYRTLADNVVHDPRAERLTVYNSNGLKKDAQTLLQAMQALDHELETESGLYNYDLPEALTQLYNQRLELFSQGMYLFAHDTGDTIAWLDKEDDSLWVVPQSLQELFNKHLFNLKIPIIFSSATLSNGGDFGYISSKLGLDTSQLKTSSIDSPFDPEEQTLVYAPEYAAESATDQIELALDQLMKLLEITQGRALILTADIAEVKRIRRALQKRLASFEFEFLWEDLADRGYLLQTFKTNISSVLVGSGFWEGIDVPGESLSIVVIWQLPFPPSDPILDSLRRNVEVKGADPAVAVDYPEMALRLKQGCGRLIRARDDRGVIALLDPFYGEPWEDYVVQSLPPGAPLTKKLPDVKSFVS